MVVVGPDQRNRSRRPRFNAIQWWASRSSHPCSSVHPIRPRSRVCNVRTC